MKKSIVLAIVILLSFTILRPTTSEAAAVDAAYRNADTQGYALQTLTKAFNKIIHNGDIATIDEDYDELSSAIKKTERAIGQVSGASRRKALNEKYVTPAKVARERVIYEVSQYRLISIMHKTFENNDFKKLEQEYAKLQRLIKRAGEIKEAGGYEALPESVVDELAYLDQWMLDRFTFTPIEWMKMYQQNDLSFASEIITTENPFISNNGSSYTNGVTHTNANSSGQHFYKLDGQYSTLEGTLVLNQSWNKEEKTYVGVLRVYAGESLSSMELVYEYNPIYSDKTEPITFNANISGASLVWVDYAKNTALVNTNFKRD
ncbi:hypothetical protein [Metabacillus endolithicus]|uniref:SbsC C-terminal domain-containing protein n=1 Tax=Metabacillus endolithicus TaxID=1535204 RepID=A0ABW5BYL3_9BACI|nr:hypothetical protein [Metabacillus endolithicus]UPG65488.1 hypothetical protein MVE64_11245 [Metabacillus endolithicus]